MKNKAFCLFLVHGVIIYLPHLIASFANEVILQQSTAKS